MRSPLVWLWSRINHAMELGKYGEDGHEHGDD